MAIKILLVDDHRITREGISSMLNKQPEMEVVGGAENGREALKLARKHSPDIVIMDITMPDLNGIDATHMMLKEFRDIKVIGFSMYSDKRFVRGMLNAGASGYILKDYGFDELVRAIHSVAKGHTYLSPEVASLIVEDLRDKNSNEGASGISILTLREREILQLISEGMSTREIASHLNVSVKTVETHMRRIMEKLGVSSTAELTKYAIKEGLTSF
ncbi:MAG: response regulator transcription factor [Pseudomonadota bacterium]